MNRPTPAWDTAHPATLHDAAALPDLATRVQVAQYTQTSVATLARWAGESRGPRFIKLGGAVRYKREAVLAWLESLEEAS